MRPRKRTVNCIVTALAVLLLLSCTQTVRRLPPPPAYQDPAYERDVFYDALAPHGTWVTHRTYGRVWYPNNITRHWRPYTDGHWQHSAQYGWVWVADQEWGWAPFHYGRWVYDDWYGWVWIPGRVWAPAWVTWRYGGGHAAWAPMPPTAVWRPHHGVDHRYFRSERDLSWDSWVSIPEERLSDRNMHRHILDRSHNRQILQKATTSSEIKLQNDHVVNEGVPVHTLERITGKKVAPAELIEVPRPDDQKGAMDTDGLKIFRPQFGPESNDDLQKDSERAEILARQLEDQQRQSGQEGAKENVAEPRQPGRLTTTDSAPEVDKQRQPAGPKGGGSAPGKDAVGGPDPFVEPSPKNGLPPDSPTLNANPAALPPADPKSATTAPPPEIQPLPRDSEKKPADQGGTKGSPQETTNQDKPSPAAPPSQPNAPSTAHPHEAGVPEQQSAPHPPPAEDLPPKSGNPPSPKLNAAPADGLKSNTADHSPSAQDKPQHNDAPQQKNPPLTTRERENSEPDPRGKGVERFEKTQTEEPPKGMPTRPQQGGDQGTSGSQIFPEQRNLPQRSRNDEKRLGTEPGGLQPQTAPPAADVAPPRMLEPTGQNRPMTPQDQQIKPGGDSTKGKKQPRKPGEPEEEEGEQGPPPK